jgi:hypothetical protein
VKRLGVTLAATRGLERLADGVRVFLDELQQSARELWIEVFRVAVGLLVFCRVEVGEVVPLLQ